MTNDNGDDGRASREERRWINQLLSPELDNLVRELNAVDRAVERPEPGYEFRAPRDYSDSIRLNGERLRSDDASTAVGT